MSAERKRRKEGKLRKTSSKKSSKKRQLPPVGANSLWVDICKELDLQGFKLYTQFKDVMILTKNNCLDKSDPDSVLFDEFLDRLRDRKNTDDDWNLLRTKCSYYAMGDAGWVERGFDDPNVTHL